MIQNKEFKKLNIILYVVSDSRNERSDKSGKVLKEQDRKEFEIHRIKTDVLIAEIIAKKN